MLQHANCYYTIKGIIRIWNPATIVQCKFYIPNTLNHGPHWKQPLSIVYSWMR